MAKELYLIHGKPGSGKTTASRLATEQLGNAYHFSMGDELRARALQGKPSQHSEELKQYVDELKRALPVPPHLATLVFEECLQTSPYNTIIVDGYPQYTDRLPAFNDTLEKAGARVLAICLIDISDDIARQRILGRAQRSTEVTEDDAYVNTRLDGFQRNVVPTIDTLSHDYPIYEINGNQFPDAVANDLVNIIGTLRDS